jgi:hypothetical protein
MPRPAQSPQSCVAAQHPPDDEGELNLYYLHDLLADIKGELWRLQDVEPEQIVATFAYLKAKDPERAALVRRWISMATLLMSDAAHMVGECIHWGRVEAQLCPFDENEAFWDTPQNWLAVGQQRAGQTAIPAATEAAANEPTAEPREEEPPSATPSDLTPSTPTPAPIPTYVPPAPAALRRHARTLRSECEREKRRFYAIAGKHGLPTGREAAHAIRGALSQLFDRPISSRKELSASDWSKAASALDTGDLCWEIPGYPASALPDGTTDEMDDEATHNAPNGTKGGTYNGTNNGTNNGAAQRPALRL